MTRWEPVAFADVRVDDTIKSESPCGTVRRGVVAAVDEACGAKDANGDYFARPSWTISRRQPKHPRLQFASGRHLRLTKGVGSRLLPVCDTCINELGLNIRWDQAPCRRAPKPAKFTPLDVPTVGQWGRFELRDGTVVTGKVESTSEHYGHDRVWLEDGVDYCLNVKREGRNSSNIIAWSPAERPTPAWHTPEPGSLWELTTGAGVGRWVALDHRPSGGAVEFRVVTNAAIHVPCTSGLITAGREVAR